MIRRSQIKRRKGPRKKTSARRLKQQLDLIIREQMLERDGHACLRCKKSNVVLQAAHVHSKGKYQRLRFELDNLLTLCIGCHLYWAHKEPLEFADWFRANWPDRADKLHSLKNSAPKVDLKEMLGALRESGK